MTITATSEIRRTWRNLLVVREEIRAKREIEARYLDSLKAFANGQTLMGADGHTLADTVSAKGSIDWKAYAIELGGTEDGAEKYRKQSVARFLVKT